MDVNIAGSIIIGWVITSGLTFLGSKQLIEYRHQKNEEAVKAVDMKKKEEIDELRRDYEKDVNMLRDEIRALTSSHNGHNREIGEMKQLMTTTAQQVAQIYGKMFSPSKPD